MTYIESNELMGNAEFSGRVKVSAMKFADSIMIELPSVPAHNARMRWATLTFQNPIYQAQQLTPLVVMDPQVQLDGAAITDAALQISVETVVNKVF